MNFYQLYHSDSYLREKEAVVVRVEGNRIALDQIVFYAQSGGQPADHGTLKKRIKSRSHLRDHDLYCLTS
jgi:misacylated tRNA(Ala) deacylase